MENTISIIADICGILGFFISIFAVSTGNTTVGGDFVGRDKK